jgi:hypothetical protein
MHTPTDAERHDEQVRQITQDLLQQAEPILADIARQLAETPDEQLFGDTEFALRDKILKLVAVALNARLAQKKTATKEVASTAPIATPLPASTVTAPDTPSASAAGSSVRGPTTTAARVGKGSRRGTSGSA